MPPRDRDSDDSDGSPNSSAGRCYKRVRIDGNAQAHLGDNHYYGSSGKDTDLDPVAKQNVILEHLYHTEMERRSITIYNLDQSACEWAFDPSKIPLGQWLEQEGGIFWITGKAGSGKSTFMKFLAQHPTTQDLLSTWAGTDRLIVAEHYFWYSTPNNLQRSFEGMLRGVLYSVLSEMRDAIPTLLPGRWAERGSRLRSAWTETELLNALRKLGMLQGVRFTFFLDGLDECIPSRDHGSLVRDLKELARDSNVKLCVSSRPWQVFETHFGTVGNRLSLHEYTFSDMVSYISSKLIEAESDTGLQTAFSEHRSDADDLVERIAVKAEGVFFWTVLVVRSLCQEIEAGRDIKDMYSYVDEVLPDLNAFFTTMVFERIDHRNQSTVARFLKFTSLLAYASIATENLHQYEANFNMSFLSFRILLSSNEAEEEDFASQAKVQHLDLHDMLSSLEQIRRYVGCMSRDLVHIPRQRSLEGLKTVRMHNMSTFSWTWKRLASFKVEFLHRAVLDYLLDADVQSLLDRHSPSHFQRPDFVARITLARVKLHPKLWIDNPFPDLIACPEEVSKPEDLADATTPSTLEYHERVRNPRLGRPIDLAGYFGNAIVDLIPHTAVWHYVPDALHDIDCCKARLPHICSDLVAEYEEAGLRWDIHAHVGSWAAIDFCMLLVSFGFTRYARRRLLSCDYYMANHMLLEAIYTLFYYPTASSNTSMLTTLLDHKQTRDTWCSATVHRQQRCWWHEILHCWGSLMQTGRLRTPRGDLVYSEEMSTALEKHIFAIAGTLCQHGHNVFEDRVWSDTESLDHFGRSLASLVPVERSNDTFRKQGWHELSFEALLNNAEKKRVLEDLLANARSG